MQPLNAKGRPFSWSFSAISDFETCPAKYASTRFYCSHKDEGTGEALIWGSRVHKALENRLKHYRPLPEGMTQWDKYCRSMIATCNTDDLYVEHQMCIDAAMQPTSWFAKNAWGRCAMDVMIDKGDVVHIYDWKTGKQKDNDLQLKIFAAMASMKFPNALEFKAKYVWLNSGNVTGTTFYRKDMPKIWEDILSRVRTMEAAWKHENFPARRCGLCRGWCVNTECPEWESRR